MILIHPITGEDRDTIYWDEYFGLRKGTMEKRALKHGAGNPIIFKYKKSYQKALRQLNYDPEESKMKKDQKARKKLEEKGQLLLFGGDDGLDD